MHCSKTCTLYCGCNDNYSGDQDIKNMDWRWNSRGHIMLIPPPKLKTNSDIDVQEEELLILLY